MNGSFIKEDIFNSGEYIGPDGTIVKTPPWLTGEVIGELKDLLKDLSTKWREGDEEASSFFGIPFPIILRTSMGIVGAKYVALLRGLVGIFMFGVQTYFISKSISTKSAVTFQEMENSPFEFVRPEPIF